MNKISKVRILFRGSNIRNKDEENEFKIDDFIQDYQY